eukprot:6177393-Prorocentrum_lima.AAC.1
MGGTPQGEVRCTKGHPQDHNIIPCLGPLRERVEYEQSGCSLTAGVSSSMNLCSMGARKEEYA